MDYLPAKAETKNKGDNERADRDYKTPPQIFDVLAERHAFFRIILHGGALRLNGSGFVFVVVGLRRGGVVFILVFAGFFHGIIQFVLGAFKPLLEFNNSLTK